MSYRGLPSGLLRKPLSLQTYTTGLVGREFDGHSRSSIPRRGTTSIPPTCGRIAPRLGMGKAPPAHKHVQPGLTVEFIRGWCTERSMRLTQQTRATSRNSTTVWTRAPGRSRTSDTRFRKPVLYPLSYEGGACRKPGRKLRPALLLALSNSEFTDGTRLGVSCDARELIQSAPNQLLCLWGLRPAVRPLVRAAPAVVGVRAASARSPSRHGRADSRSAAHARCCGLVRATSCRRAHG